MKRRERIAANEEGRLKPRPLNESDFLLGVYDEARMGALRFSLKDGGEYLSSEKDLSTPPFENCVRWKKHRENLKKTKIFWKVNG